MLSWLKKQPLVQNMPSHTTKIAHHTWFLVPSLCKGGWWTSTAHTVHLTMCED
jgi:hypothetical protein